MKRSLPVLLPVICLMFLCSCVTKRYTHQQVMQGFHNEADVTRQFGKPDKRRAIDSTEEWTYYHYKGPKATKTITPNLQPAPIGDTSRSAQSGTYIRFVFDADGNVEGYKSQGVDMGYVKKDNFGSAALRIAGIAALILIIIGLDVYNNTDVGL
jgi:hypothetical protein